MAVRIVGQKEMMVSDILEFLLLVVSHTHVNASQGPKVSAPVPKFVVYIQIKKTGEASSLGLIVAMRLNVA